MTNRASGIIGKNVGIIIKSPLHVTGSDLVTMSVYSFTQIAVLKLVKDS